MPHRGIAFPRLVALLLLGAAFATACLMGAQADTFWHLRAGHEFWQTGRIPLVDHYSYTAAGRAWPNHEWLWQAVSYPIFALGGFPALTLAAATIVTAACAVTWRLVVGSWQRRLGLALWGLPLSATVWALRPQLVSLLCLSVLLRLVAGERWRWIPFLFVVWANFHGAVFLGLAVLGATAVAALGDRKRLGRVAAVTALSAAATLVTPLGAGLWSFVVESIGRSREVSINEWRPASPLEPVGAAFWIFAVVYVVVLARRWRALPAFSDRALALGALVLLPLAARHGRNISPFLFLAIPALSRLWAVSPPRVRESADHGRLNAAFLAVFLALGGSGVAWAWARPLPSLGWHPVPAEAVTAVRACPGRLYNRYDDGGFLVWMAPETPVFIDSRQDPYPRDLVAAHVRDEASGDFAPTFERWEIRCAFLPIASPTAQALTRAGWRSRYRGAAWTVLEAP